MSVKKKKNGLVSKLVSIVLIVMTIFVLSRVLKKIYTMFSLQNASLVATKEKLEDPEYIRTYARGEYMFSKGDEKVFYLP